VAWIRKSMALDPGRIQLYNALAFAYLDLDDLEAANRVRTEVEALDDQHFILGLLDTFVALHRKNYAAALEAANWVNDKIGQIPDFQEFFGFMYLIQGELEKAKSAFRIAEPRFFDRATWRAAIEQQNSQGCINAWLLMQTGEEALGQSLLDMTLAYMEVELPNYIAHADRYGYMPCYLAKGDLNKALESLETTVEHGHYGGWWLWTTVPLWEPLRGEPRFEAALQSIRDRVAIQRENLRRMEAEATL
jgi:tetratricopeptide (TPR) repeat protein